MTTDQPGQTATFEQNYGLDAQDGSQYYIHAARAQVIAAGTCQYARSGSD